MFKKKKKEYPKEINMWCPECHEYEEVIANSECHERGIYHGWKCTKCWTAIHMIEMQKVKAWIKKRDEILKDVK